MTSSIATTAALTTPTPTVAAGCRAPGIYRGSVGVAAAPILPAWSASRTTPYLRGSLVLDPASSGGWVCVRGGERAPSAVAGIDPPTMPAPPATPAVTEDGFSFVQTDDGAQWCSFDRVGNGWLISNRSAQGGPSLYVAIDENTDVNGDAIYEIAPQQTLEIPWTVAPADLRVLGSAAAALYQLVVQA